MRTEFTLESVTDSYLENLLDEDDVIALGIGFPEVDQIRMGKGNMNVPLLRILSRANWNLAFEEQKALVAVGLNSNSELLKYFKKQWGEAFMATSCETLAKLIRAREEDDLPPDIRPEAEWVVRTLRNWENRGGYFDTEGGQRFEATHEAATELWPKQAVSYTIRRVFSLAAILMWAE